MRARFIFLPALALVLSGATIMAPTGGGGGGGYTGPVVDASVTTTGTFSSAGGSNPINITTTTANTDIFIVLFTESSVATAQITGITNILPALLTWAKVSPSGSGHNAQITDDAVLTAVHSNLEVWWARAPTADVYTAVTIAMDNPVDAGVFVAFGVTNGNATNPQDANASIAASAAGASSAHPTVTGVSTTAASSLLVSAAGTASPTVDCPGIASSPVPTGYTEIQHIDFGGAVINYACVSVAYKQVSAAQSGVAATWNNSSTWPNWLSLVTALKP